MSIRRSFRRRLELRWTIDMGTWRLLGHKGCFSVYCGYFTIYCPSYGDCCLPEVLRPRSNMHFLEVSSFYEYF